MFFKENICIFPLNLFLLNHLLLILNIIVCFIVNCSTNHSKFLKIKGKNTFEFFIKFIAASANYHAVDTY